MTPAGVGRARRLRARLAALDAEIAERQAEREAVARALAPFDAAEWEARRQREAEERRADMESRRREMIAEHHRTGRTFTDGTGHTGEPLDGCAACARLLG